MTNTSRAAVNKTACGLMIFSIRGPAGSSATPFPRIRITINPSQPKGVSPPRLRPTPEAKIAVLFSGWHAIVANRKFVLSQ